MVQRPNGGRGHRRGIDFDVAWVARPVGSASGLTMSNPFFDHPILNSPYQCPARHWELDPDGQPTQKVLERRRAAEFITPVPKPKKR